MRSQGLEQEASLQGKESYRNRILYMLPAVDNMGLKQHEETTCHKLQEEIFPRTGNWILFFFYLEGFRVWNHVAYYLNKQHCFII